MSFSQSFGQDWAAEVAELYRAAELRILTRVTAAIADGLEPGEFDTRDLARAQALRLWAQAELEKVNRQAAAKLADVMNRAYLEGNASVLADVGRLVPPVELPPAARQAAVQVAAANVLSAVQTVTPSVLRAVDDVYRQVVGRAVASTVAGVDFRKVAAQRALDELTSRGITGIQTARGAMNLPDYVSMATRTGTRQTMVAGHAQQMQSMGLDLVAIQPGPRACDICDRWASRILALSGPAGRIEMQSYTSTETLTVDVYGNLSDAESAGFGHPNCRCRLRAWMPGASNPKDLERPRWDRAAYESQQKQRGIEHNIRRWKSREAAALTPEARKLSAGKVAEWQKAQRTHLAEHDYLKRQYSREQIGRTI